MKWLSFVALLLSVSAASAGAQWVVPPSTNWLKQGDFDRPRPAHHRAGIRPLSVPHSAIPNWPFPNIDVTNSPAFGQFEPSVAINPTDSNDIIIGYIDDSSFSTLAYSATTDGGITWSRKLLPQRTDVAFNGATDPSVAFEPQGSALFALGFYDGASVNNAVGLFQSTDLGNDWMPRADAFENVSGDTISDKFYIAVDRSASSRFSGRIYISWVDQGEPGYVRIVCAYSSDQGQSWSVRRYLSGLGHYTAPVPVTEPDGTLLVAYVDYY
ncbi:MAG TPA: sialidase family protein, partial [Candidatus Kapabacteria bacterium]|nr:sialidase family protein [Candidatus Kapabacteria bacterium]